MVYQYAYQGKETHARSLATNISVSLKQTREICLNIRGMSLEKAKRFLEKVVTLQQAVAYKRYNRDVGHKTGMASGRYPVKASKAILGLLKTAEANAQVKGMSIGDLVVSHILSQKAATTPRYGRRRGITARRSHIEIVLEEKKIEKTVEEKKTEEKEKVSKKEEKKAEEKKVQPEKGIAEKKVEPQKKEEVKEEKNRETKEKQVAEQKEQEKKEQPKEEKKEEVAVQQKEKEQTPKKEETIEQKQGEPAQ